LVKEVADKGYPPAQSYYGFTPAEDALINPTEEQITQYNQKAELYRQKAAENGSLLALLGMAINYDSGFRLNKDPVKALLYTLALQEFAKRPDIVNMMAKDRDRLESQLSQEQINDAITQSAELIEKINANGAVYPEWRKDE
jgi:TPR repeat protein